MKVRIQPGTLLYKLLIKLQNRKSKTILKKTYLEKYLWNRNLNIKKRLNLIFIIGRNIIYGPMFNNSEKFIMNLKISWENNLFKLVKIVTNQI